MSLSVELEALLARYPPEVRELAVAVRGLVLALRPDLEETLDEKAGLVGYGSGPGFKGLIFTLILSQGGVKLGLSPGAELADPHGLLGGRGKVHRHLAFQTSSDLDRPGLATLLEEAFRAWQARAIR
jgi:hypothetical protein